MNISDQPSGEFVVTRTFDAPRELVWKAWTEPDCLTKWWGPVGLEVEVAKLDLRPGGIFHYGMRTPDGHQMWGKFIYQEVTPPERLVYVVSFSDADAGITRHPLSADWPLEMLSTMTLTEQDGKTTLTGTTTPVNATDLERKTFADSFKGMNTGWTGTMDQLDTYLKTA